MAFHFNAHESARKGLRRVLKKELKAAMAELRAEQPTAESVHEARKHIKKARAVVRLLARSTPVKSVRKDLRHAGRLLSSLRDSQAIADDAGKMFAANRTSLSNDTRAALDSVLKAQQRHSQASARRHRAVGRATVALARAQRSLKAVRWSDVDNREFERAVQNGYKRAQRGMTRARTDGESRAFHEWRKRVKHLWYALRLLANTTANVHDQVADLDELETWLGEDHNLFVLRQWSEKRLLPATSEASQIAALVTERQARLRRMALQAGATLFEETPRSFRKGLWK